MNRLVYGRRVIMCVYEYAYGHVYICVFTGEYGKSVIMNNMRRAVYMSVCVCVCMYVGVCACSCIHAHMWLVYL